MLYLTLEDDPFATQEHDEENLLELVRTVARRNTDDRTVSELIRLRDSLDRLGLLWTPFDLLDKYQSIELARNLHLELAAPGDMIYNKQTPAMRSYVLLRGAVLLSSNVLDREGNEGTRLLVPGNEFGAILDPDLDPDQPVEAFEEYAKAPHMEAGIISDGSGSGGGGTDAVDTVRGGGRKDGRAELLVIGRQDWISTVKCSTRRKFAEAASKDTAGKGPDDLKKKARVAFNFPAKGRREEHLAIARQYLTERVPFCSDLPEEPLSALAAALEIYGLTVPRRTIFRRGRECYGEAYIMFTGSADQKGGEASEDRLIKEGDLFGDNHFGIGDNHTQDGALRTATVSNRVAPCELLVLPARECRRLQAFVAVRNSKKARVIFENFFHNMPSDTSLELSLIAKIRKINMHEKLASEGDGVTSVFFVFRGECLAKSRALRGDTQERRFGPGEIIGWPHLMPDKSIARPTSTSGARGAAAGIHKSMPVDATVQSDVAKPAKNLRPRRNGKEWQDTITVATPAQVLSISLVGVLGSLSERALQGLRGYISLVHKSRADEDDITTVSLPDAGTLWGAGVAGDSASCLEGFHTPGRLVGQGGHSSKGTRRRVKSAGKLQSPFGEGSERAILPASVLEGRKEVPSERNPWRYEPRPNSRTNWRWRVDLTKADKVSRGSSRQNSPTARVALWDSFEQAKQSQQARRVRLERRRLCGCTCPVEMCTVCLSTPRFSRFQRTSAWAPSLPPRATTLSNASMPAARLEGGELCVDRAASPPVPATSALPREGNTSCVGVDRAKSEASIGTDDAKGRGARDKGEAVRFGGRTSGRLHAGPTPAHVFFVESAEVVNKRTASPEEKQGVTVGARQGGRNLESGGDVARTNALTTTKQRVELGAYALVQLSTRKRLDASEPLATLFVRLLGSFQTEAEAKNRVLHLYHYVLGEKPKWMPYQRSACPGYDAAERLSDHMFLLRKGVPVQWLSFDVGTESIVDPIDEREGVGRGYDVDFPAVFKAKGQHFAVSFVFSANTISEEWEEEQRRREEKREQERLRQKGQELAIHRSVQPVASTVTTTSALGYDSEVEVASGRPLNAEHHTSTSQDGSASPVEGESNSGSVRPDAPGPAEPQEQLLADGSGGPPEEIRDDLRVELGSADDCSSSHDELAEPVEMGVGTAEAQGGEHEPKAQTRGPSADMDGRGHDNIDLENEEGATCRGTGGAGGDGVVAAAVSSGALPSLGPTADSLDHLLDKSDTESSRDDVRSRSQHGEPEEDRLFRNDTSSGVDGCSQDADMDQATILPWAVTRMGMVEKVEGYHETEAAAFKKAVEILEKMERTTSGTHIPLAPFAEETPKPPQCQASRRVCVVPLYGWLSLGDGRIGGMERAIMHISVSEPSEAKRAGVDPFTVWNNQRTRMLRSNIYNILRAAGSREVRSRCGLTRNDGTAASAKGRERQPAAESGPYRARDEDEEVEERAADSARRKRTAKEAVHRARDTVLNQNQKLILTEMSARRRLEKKKLPLTDDDASLSSRPASVSSTTTSPRWRGEDREPERRLGDAGSSIESRRRKAITDGSDGCGDAPGTRFGPGAAGREGLRREQRIQMNIERKRARLFEDIRMLPYISVSASAGGNITTDADGRQGAGKTRLPDDGQGDATNPSSIVLRAATVQAKTRLYGKPASSFFARAYTTTTSTSTSAAAAVLKTTREDEEHDQLPSNDGNRLTHEEMEQLPEDIDPPDAALKHHARHFAGKENQAASRRSSVSSVSTASIPGTAGGASITDTSTISRSERGRTKGLHTLTKLGGRSAIRQESRRPGLAGTKRRVKRTDSWSTASSSVGGCNLDGELVLLDGILHDPKIKTWVETTLGPAKSVRP